MLSYHFSFKTQSFHFAFFLNYQYLFCSLAWLFFHLGNKLENCSILDLNWLTRFDILNPSSLHICPFDMVGRKMYVIFLPKFSLANQLQQLLLIKLIYFSALCKCSICNMWICCSFSDLTSLSVSSSTLNFVYFSLNITLLLVAFRWYAIVDIIVMVFPLNNCVNFHTVFWFS